jgi:hypothetical protein
VNHADGEEALAHELEVGRHGRLVRGGRRHPRHGASRLGVGYRISAWPSLLLMLLLLLLLLLLRQGQEAPRQCSAVVRRLKAHVGVMPRRG